MSGPDPAPAARPRRQGFWLTVGEIVGVLALVIAGLNFWESHQQHQEDVRRAQAQTQAATAFVVVGEADKDGRFVTLRPLKASQAIQSQRYRFPGEVLDHPVDISAERPRIGADWIAGGLKRALDEGHAKGSGEARVPVVIETTFVEDGDTRTDVSLYQLGFAWKRGLLGGRQVRLTGLALAKRQLPGDPTPLLNTRWTTAKAALGAG
ncbi:MAG TPA: hypothetical protein VKQ54_09535 [Caulobacteraceae bacterium]|nr:hypothetical protein [Caulobacteraceae bacterium]